MAVENRNVKVGQKFEARYKGAAYHATVTKVEQGDVAGVKVKELGGQEFKSLSTAGKAIMGGVACNGWRFFYAEGSLPAPREAKPKAKKVAKSKAAKKAPAKKPASITKARAKKAAKPKTAKAVAAKSSEKLDGTNGQE